MRPRRSVALAAVAVAGMLLAAAPSAAAYDPAIPPVPVAPADGAALPTASSPLFRVQGQIEDDYLYLWLHVSRSPAVDAQGVIADDVELEPLSSSSAGPGIFDAQPTFFDFPEYWMNQPGTYYWQVHRISYANGADGAIEGPVRSFTLVAPQEPPVVPPVDPSPGGSAGFPDLTFDPIPRWAARVRRNRMFVTSRANLPSSVARARWLALVDATARRWGLRRAGAVSGSARGGNYRNEVGFSYDLPSSKLGVTETLMLVRYRLVWVCDRRGCGYRRRVASRTVVDRDVRLNHWVRWQQGPTLPGRRQMDLQTVLIHEMGHFAGNGHARACRNTPMVAALAPGEWWRGPDDYGWRGCGSRAAVATTEGRLDHRVLRVAVPVRAGRATVDRRLAAAVERARREALSRR